MNDEKKTKKQLINELGDLRQRITELEESKTESSQSEKELMDNSLDSIMVTETIGYITKVNTPFLELLGYTEEEVVGKFVADLTPSNEGEIYESVTGESVKIDKEYSDNTMTLIDELLTKGRVANWEAYYLRKDNKVVPIEQNIVCLYDTQGERTGAISIIRDITDRKRVEKELAQHREGLEGLVKERTAELSETKDYLDNIIENSLDGIVIGDSTGNIIRVNESLLKLLGYPREEIIGKHVMELSIMETGEYESITGEIVTIGKEVFEEARKIIYETLFEEGKISNWNNYYLRKDGKIVCIEQNIFYLYNKEGDIIGSVGINRDITLRKKQEEELKKAYDELEKRVEERTSQLMQAKEEAETSNRTKSDFLANMSHELRTPLNHIIGFTEIVVDKRCGGLNESQEEYLNDVLKSSRHLLALINDILDLSKVEAGKFELDPTEVDPRLLLDNCLVMFKEKAMKHGIKLTSHIDHIPETITVDERKMKQIVYNILANAMKFTPDGGSVSVDAQMVNCLVRPGLRSGDPEGLKIISGGNGTGEIKGKKHRQCVQFSVADSGIGIKPEDQDRIFDPFEQADGSSSRKYQGTGLGLPLTRKLVELHGGRMWVESEGAGKGATFSFIIPT
jgi:PAS domain S-box-containing protein